MRAAATCFALALWLLPAAARAQDQVPPPPGPGGELGQPTPDQPLQPGQPPPGYAQQQPVQPGQGYPPGQVTTQEGYQLVYPQQQQPIVYPPAGRRRVLGRYHEGDPIPPGATIEQRRRPGLWVTGLVVFLVHYSISLLVAGVAAEIGASEPTVLAVPVLGPFILAGKVNNEDTSGAITLCVYDGLAQAVGLALFAAGIISRDYLVGYAVGERRLALGPMLAPGGGGLLMTLF
jgi:hypothetical protein